MTSIVDKEHVDITYLKQDEIGLVIAKGLTETYKAQPRDPVEYFAKYLLNFSKSQKRAKDEREKDKVVKDLREQHTQQIKSLQDEEEQVVQRDLQKQAKVTKFYQLLEKSEDLSDNLDELAEFLQQYTKATGVYIGKLEKPRKEIGDDDDDKAHFDRENPKVLRFIYTSSGHEFMRNNILKPDQGISHEVFKEPEAEEGGEVQAEEELEEGAEPKPKIDDILSQYRHIYVKEVVREPKMHFYKVPRLGAFMAIPLEYFSCLSENALENAVQDYLGVQKSYEEQEKLKAEWEEENQKAREDKEKIGEVFEPEQKEWEVIEEKPFDTKKKSFVVCIDLLGQDRELTDDERRFILETVRNFKDIWERTEQENLRKDRDRKLEIMEIDKQFLDLEAQKLMDEEEKHVEEYIAMSEEVMDDELKDIYQKAARVHFIARLFKEREDWKKNLMNIKNFKVMKMPRVLQSIFYFLHYKRDQVCQKGTNKFFWKFAKNHLDEDFLNRLVYYKPLGPKEERQERYTTINFIERNIEGINYEDVDSYNLTLGKLFKWMLLSIKTRKEDITRRKAMKRKAREERELLIQKEKDRQQKMEQDAVEAEQKFMEEHKEEIEAAQKFEDAEKQKKDDEYGEEDGDEVEEKEKVPKEKPQMPEFDHDEYQQKWIEDNPIIEIPPPIVDDVDNDWYMNEEEEEALINAYFQAKEAA